MATSLIVPVAYITVLVTALAIFSRVYRRRQIAEKTSFEPWFPSHPARETYITLLSAEPSVPDSLLKAALLVRATADVKRIWRIRDDKITLTNLHSRGLIGDDTMSRFAAAEKELEAEIVDVVSEANTFRPGWGQMIFATATEMAQAEKTRETVMNIPKLKAIEEKRLALRNRYLPKSTSAQTAITPSTSANSVMAGTPSASPSTEPVNKVATPQKVPSGSETTSPQLQGEESGSTGSSKQGTPVIGGSPALNTVAGTPGSNSTASTPSKSTPNRKKGKKK